MPDLKQQLQTYVNDSIERIDADDITAVMAQPGAQGESRISLRPAWAFVLGAALVLVLGGVTWFALGAVDWRLKADETVVDVAAPPDAETASSQWNPILAQTKARQAPPAASCPPGSNPGVLGPPDQQRPWGGAWSNQAAVFDQHAGRIIFIDETGETWTFDVCSNTWEKADPTLVPANRHYWYDNYPTVYPTVLPGELVYDVDSDKTIAFGTDVLAVYDATTNTWTQRSKPSGYDTGLAGLGAVYDPVSGLVVVQTAEAGLFTYDVDTDTWTRIGTVQGNLIGYSTETDRLAFLGGFAPRGSMVDARSGEASDLNPPTGGVAGGFGRIGYATSTDSPVVEGDGICRLNPVSLDWTCISFADGPNSDGVGLLASIVGDPINDRIVLIYGYGQGFNGERFYEVNDIWAIDFETGEWTQLLTQTGERTFETEE